MKSNNSLHYLQRVAPPQVHVAPVGSVLCHRHRPAAGGRREFVHGDVRASSASSSTAVDDDGHAAWLAAPILRENYVSNVSITADIP